MNMCAVYGEQMSVLYCRHYKLSRMVGLYNENYKITIPVQNCKVLGNGYVGVSKEPFFPCLINSLKKRYLYIVYF